MGGYEDWADKSRLKPKPLLASGMTLLDYFAGRALAGMLTSPHNDDATPEMYARASYDVARAMLKERPTND